MQLLLDDDDATEDAGFRHTAHGLQVRKPRAAARSSEDRWVINKLRALCTWYTKGFEGGSHFRIGVNSAKSIAEVEALVEDFFLSPPLRRRLRRPGSPEP